MITLPNIWICLIGFIIIMYVILDGFDLGIGIISGFIGDEHQRDIIISTIMPVWDGNETWLVLGGATLYGAFPDAFAYLLPKLYIPILIMVCSLLFRGVAFEFRLKAGNKKIWERSFFIGSVVATLIQGIMLGTFVAGFDTHSSLNTMSMSPYAWLNPFSFCCGAALLFGYTLLGANWLIMKTTGDLQRRCYDISKVALVVVAVFGALISFWSPFIDPAIEQRWFGSSDFFYLLTLPIITFILFLLHWKALKERKEYSPFFLAVGIFLLCYAGFIISSWPYIVPRSMTIAEAAAPNDALAFMLVGAVIMLPILLYYTYHSYKIFRGKVTDVIGY